ncbi:hypothetical protein NMG60_11012586 [Bertholletia excelsa]
MSTKATSASSPPPIDASSSSTVKETEPVRDMGRKSASFKNSTQIASTAHPNDIDKQPSGAVDDPANMGKSSNISKQNAPTPTSTTTGNKSTGNDDDKDAAKKEIESLKNVISADLLLMGKTHKRVTKLLPALEACSERFKELQEGHLANADDFRELKKAVKKLKQEINAKYKEEDEGLQELLLSLLAFDTKKPTIAAIKKAEQQFPQLIKEDWVGVESSYFREFKARYLHLSDEKKLCLLCFSVFPKDEEIKKRVMINWWIGEGFVPLTSANKTNSHMEEKWANDFFGELIRMGFIHPIYKKGKLRRADTCKIQPFVRSMLIKIAKKANFFDFDEDGNPKADYLKSMRSCLTGTGLESNLRSCFKGTELDINQVLENLHALFNVKEAILELKSEWLSKMKNINVLYLGRWQASAAHHIEIEDITTLKKKNANVLDGLENMKHLRFLSLQGISRITELPGNISNLTGLKILDLRACHNLETIPDEIGSLHNLTHLDMSECYLLDQMPERLSHLSNLAVLSGFVVGETGRKNSCTLADLQNLQKLRKLSIQTSLNDFPMEDHLRALYEFRKLEKLTITWGRGSMQPDKKSGQAKEATNTPISQSQTLSTLEQEAVSPNKEGKEDEKRKENSEPGQPAACAGKIKFPFTIKKSRGNPSSENRRGKKEKELAKLEGTCLLPPELKKLDLQCFPDLTSREWVKPCNLKNLQKLYIRGGKFSDLGQFQEFAGKDKWEKVKELRLKYLNELEMDWKELLELFPKLKYLEKVNCPKLTFFPCDQTGVWMRK